LRAYTLYEKPANRLIFKESATISATRPGRNSWVVDIYFVRCTVTGLIKIGLATHFDYRFRDLCFMSPTPLEKLRVLRRQPRSLERQLHALFASHRAHGEWFRASPELTAALALTDEALLAHIASHAPKPFVQHVGTPKHLLTRAEEILSDYQRLPDGSFVVRKPR
jgi:Meiotically Up-regulated Gene 113 (MUG113) protein